MWSSIVEQDKRVASWAEFSDALLVLVSTVFPDFQHKALKRLALDRYLDQLAP